jgi:hypothetical protein
MIDNHEMPVATTKLPAQQLQRAGQPVACHHAGHATGAGAQRAGLPVQRRQAATGDEQQHQAEDAQHVRQARDLDAGTRCAKTAHRAEGHRQRQQVAGLAEQVVQQVGRPCAEAANAVMHDLAAAGAGPARIVGVMAQQSHQQDQRQHRQRDGVALAQPTQHCRGNL